MENEIWVDIPEFENIYQVSNLGRVKSSRKRKIKELLDEKFLKPKTDKYGYYIYGLCKNGKMKHFSAHRLVCISFIINDNPLKKNQINHIDGNKKNNNVTNLEWCDSKHNNREAVRIGLKGGKCYKPRINSCKINKYDKSGNLIKTYINLAEASRLTGILKTSISNCLKNRSKTSGGYIWRFLKEETL